MGGERGGWGQVGIHTMFCARNRSWSSAASHWKHNSPCLESPRCQHFIHFPQLQPGFWCLVPKPLKWKLNEKRDQGGPSCHIWLWGMIVKQQKCRIADDTLAWTNGKKIDIPFNLNSTKPTETVLSRPQSVFPTKSSLCLWIPVSGETKLVSKHTGTSRWIPQRKKSKILNS